MITTSVLTNYDVVSALYQVSQKSYGMDDTLKDPELSKLQAQLTI